MRVETWKAGSSAGRPTTYSVLPPPMSITSVSTVVGAGRGGAEEGQAGLLVAGDRARGRCRSAPAARSRNSGPFSASRMALVATPTISAASEPVDDLPVALEGLLAPAHRRVGEPARGVHALAEAGDDRAPLELGDGAVVHVRHQQTGRVGAQVDDRDAGHARHRTRPACASRQRLTSRATVARFTNDAAGWSSQVARRAHNPKVAGSNPAPATQKRPCNRAFSCCGAALRSDVDGPTAVQFLSGPAEVQRSRKLLVTAAHPLRFTGAGSQCAR